MTGVSWPDEFDRGALASIGLASVEALAAAASRHTPDTASVRADVVWAHGLIVESRDSMARACARAHAEAGAHRDVMDRAHMVTIGTAIATRTSWKVADDPVTFAFVEQLVHAALDGAPDEEIPVYSHYLRQGGGGVLAVGLAEAAQWPRVVQAFTAAGRRWEDVAVRGFRAALGPLCDGLADAWCQPNAVPTEWPFTPDWRAVVSSETDEVGLAEVAACETLARALGERLGDVPIGAIPADALGGIVGLLDDELDALHLAVLAELGAGADPGPQTNVGSTSRGSRALTLADAVATARAALVTVST